MAMHEERSFERRVGRTGPGGRLLFLLSLWMSLATAIVCAVVPAGLPQTRLTGSAFDPSTTIVALRSRPPATIKAPELREDDGVGVGDGGAALALPVRDAIIPASALLPAIGFFPVLLVPLSHAIPVALYARPPPTV